MSGLKQRVKKSMGKRNPGKAGEESESSRGGVQQQTNRSANKDIDEESVNVADPHEASNTVDKSYDDWVDRDEGVGTNPGTASWK